MIMACTYLQREIGFCPAGLVLRHAHELARVHLPHVRQEQRRGPLRASGAVTRGHPTVAVLVVVVAVLEDEEPLLAPVDHGVVEDLVVEAGVALVPLDPGLGHGTHLARDGRVLTWKKEIK